MHVQGKKRVVIVGAGFAGLWAAKRLARSDAVRVVLVDRNNYHTFLPLLYQVAAAELEPEAIAYPLRGIFRGKTNVSLAMAEATGVDTERRTLFTDGPDIPYDHLILATGSQPMFFNTPGAQEHSFTLKSLEDAVRLRNHLLSCFELAVLDLEAGKRAGLLDIVVVGGGPTGVECAGALAELIRGPLAKDFPDLTGHAPRVTLINAGEEVLAGFPQRLRKYAHKRLAGMGVDMRLGCAVAEARADGVSCVDGSHLPACTTIWTAGVRGHDLGARLGLPLGRSGRVEVLPTLQTAAHQNIHVIGDLSLPHDQSPPMVAPNATQQGRHAAENILRLLRGEEPLAFAYRDKGGMAVIGRQAAVARLGTFSVSGLPAWLIWLFVHLAYLIGFRNRVLALMSWAWDYFFSERAVRLILPRERPVRQSCCDAAEPSRRE